MVTKKDDTKKPTEVPPWKQTKGFRFESETDFHRVQAVADRMALGAPVDMATALRALVLMALPEAEKQLGVVAPPHVEKAVDKRAAANAAAASAPPVPPHVEREVKKRAAANKRKASK